MIYLSMKKYKYYKGCKYINILIVGSVFHYFDETNAYSLHSQHKKRVNTIKVT